MTRARLAGMGCIHYNTTTSLKSSNGPAALSLAAQNANRVLVTAVNQAGNASNTGSWAKP